MRPGFSNWKNPAVPVERAGSLGLFKRFSAELQGRFDIRQRVDLPHVGLEAASVGASAVCFDGRNLELDECFSE